MLLTRPAEVIHDGQGVCEMPRIPTEKIAEAARLLREAADPVRIILFGSQARGEAGEDSDLDFLVVEREVANLYTEMARLRHALSPLRVPADVLVATEEDLREYGEVPGTVYHDALVQGKVLYEAV